MTRILSLLAALLLASPVIAQTAPGLPGGDSRLQTVIYDPNRVVRLRVPLGYQTTVVLEPGEQIDTIALGDSGGWQVTPSDRGDHLFIKPVDAGEMTNLTVVTDTRLYSFELAATYGPTAETPFTLRFIYPTAEPEAASSPAVVEAAAYRLSGAEKVRPARVSDDGVRTFIDWAPGNELPAMFALDGRGREVLVTGYMRDERFVIDAVYSTLIFRLDRQVARATRIQGGAGR